MQKAMQSDAAVFRYVLDFIDESVPVDLHKELSKHWTKVFKKCDPSTRALIT